MATATRIYRITIGETDRLVRTSSPAAALMHVARDIARVSVASQDDLVECLSDGVRVEVPAQEPEAGAAPRRAKAAPAAEPVDTRAPLFAGLDVGGELDEISDAEGLDMHGEEEPEPGPALRTMPTTRPRNAAAYRHPSTGESWSGRGLKPRWLRDELEAGRTLSEFAVTA